MDTPSVELTERIGPKIAPALNKLDPIVFRPTLPFEIRPGETVALLVAGVNYPRKSQGYVFAPNTNGTYFGYCQTYKDYLLAKGIVTRVIILHFLKGEVYSYRRGASEEMARSFDPVMADNYRFEHDDRYTLARPPAHATDGPIRPVKLYYPGIRELATALGGDAKQDVATSAYDPWPATQMKEKSLSVLDVYLAVRRAPPDTIAEVHFFGHAVGGGPVIVNTKGYPNKEFDKDCRVQDFANLKYVFEAGLKAFRQALRPDALLMIWGCLMPGKAEREQFVVAMAQLAKGARRTREIKSVLDSIRGSYAKALAIVADRPVVAALPVMSAVHQPTDADSEAYTPRLMHLSMKLGRQHMANYKKHLGEGKGSDMGIFDITFASSGINTGDPEFGRGYAVYPP
jgi:hypothetical protein